MSLVTESLNSARHSHEIIVPRLSVVTTDSATMPYARSRKLSRSMTTLHVTGSAPPLSPTSPTDTLILPGRKGSRSASVTFVRKMSQFQAASGKSSVDLTKAPSDNNRSSLPPLTESRRMNFSDVIIWRRLTRALKQRVAERRTEKRTFCWLDRSVSSRSGNNNELENQVEPSYRMEPAFKLPQSKCREMISAYLTEKLKNVTYEPIECGEMAKIISDEIKQKAKTEELLPPRYKCVVQAVLGEKKDQGIRVSSQSALDEKTDNFLSESFQNGSIFCVVMFYAVYKE